MPLNKEIIIRIVVTIIVIVIFIKVVGPILFDFFKKKIPGYYEPENDIDSMIRRQKEKLKAQYGLTSPQSQILPLHNENESSGIKIESNTNVTQIFKEAKWGSSETNKNIQTEIQKNYSYSMVESKINSFLLLVEKKKYIYYLSEDNINSKQILNNYLSTLLIFLIIIDEIKNKQLDFVGQISKKIKIPKEQLAIAIQIKILTAMKSKNPDIKDARLFNFEYTLHQYSSETIALGIDTILKKEANLWALGHSHFFEELALFLNYSNLLSPLPVLKDKNDIDTALTILNSHEDMTFDEIKKAYKLIAMNHHPDKISGLKLHPILEKKAIEKFNKFQEAYELISNKRKK